MFQVSFFRLGVTTIGSILFDILLSMLHVSGPRIALEDMYLQHEKHLEHGGVVSSYLAVTKPAV